MKYHQYTQAKEEIKTRFYLRQLYINYMCACQ